MISDVGRVTGCRVQGHNNITELLLQAPVPEPDVHLDAVRHYVLQFFTDQPDELVELFDQLRGLDAYFHGHASFARVPQAGAVVEVAVLDWGLTPASLLTFHQAAARSGQ